MIHFDSGPLRYPLTNDYMFKCVCQDNEAVLRGFLAALLHCRPEDITSLQVLNPIEPGRTILEKEIILDIKLLLNQNQIINIEMQVVNRHDWVERSLVYISRTLAGQLKHGEPYQNLRPTLHVGILDFELFDSFQTFHSHYVPTEQSGHIYSGKWAIDVVNLRHIEEADDEDIRSGLQAWARLFKARTWEDLKMAASNNEIMKGAVLTLRKLSADEKIQLECEAREMYEHDMASLREYARTEGLAEGRAEGRAEGEARLAGLLQLLINSGRSDDVARAVADSEYRKLLYQELHL